MFELILLGIGLVVSGTAVGVASREMTDNDPFYG